jgi:hypothetical protein
MPCRLLSRLALGILLLWSLAACTAVTVGPSPSATTPTAMPTPTDIAGTPGERLLARLRWEEQILHQRHQAAPDRLTEIDQEISPTPLVGMTKSKIEAALGKTDLAECPLPECPERSGTVCFCSPTPEAPGIEMCAPDCQFSADRDRCMCPARDFRYGDFYYLPKGMVGGGPEMRLTFDRAGVCTSAAWVHTQ